MKQAENIAKVQRIGVRCTSQLVSIEFQSFTGVIEKYMSRTAYLLSALSLIAAVGCSGSGLPATYKVTGTVKLDGKAVEGALVTFHPGEGQKVAVGSTDADGVYKLSTFGPADGALPGSYKVTVTKLDIPPTGSAPPLPQGVLADGEITESYAPPTRADASENTGPPKNLLPEKYASEATSGLIATVAENNSNSFDFEL